MTRVVELASGHKITLRSLTEAEAIRLSDQRAAAALPGEKLTDKTDDGDDEVIGCITDPDRAVVLDLLDDYPRLPRRLEELLRKMGGEDLAVIERTSLATEEMIANHGKRLLGLCVVPEGWTPQSTAAPLAELVLRKYSRVELKLLEQAPETRKRGRPSWAQLAAAAKAHAVQADAGVWERFPFLSQTLGLLLWQAASIQVAAVEGK